VLHFGDFPAVDASGGSPVQEIHVACVVKCPASSVKKSRSTDSR
jgi:hypothetical protein